MTRKAPQPDFFVKHLIILIQKYMSQNPQIELQSNHPNKGIDHQEIQVNTEVVPGYKSYVQRSGILKYIFFLFELPTIKKAKSLIKQGKALDQKTLPSLGWNERAEVLEEGINRHLEGQKRRGKKKPSLVLALLWSVRVKLFLSILLEVFLMFARIFSCYCCKQLIEALAEPDAPNGNSYKWAGILCGVLCGALFMEHHFYYLKTTFPLTIRGAIISMIYTKISRLSLYSLNKISLGKLVNIVANDVNVFERSGAFFPNLISGIIGLIAGTALLWIFFGPICLVGIGYIVLTFPLQRFITKLSVKPRSAQNKVTDERVRVTNEVIEGIRLLKMYTWELIFRDNVNEIRKKEVGFLTKVHSLEGLSRGVAFSAQAVACFLIFMPYNLMGNDLEISKVFPSFFLIGFLRMNAIFLFSLGLNFIAEAKLLIERVMNILETPEMGETIFDEPKNPENAIEFDNFTAYWTKEDESSESIKTEHEKINSNDRPVLSNVNLNIKKGSLNALVGKIGAGKSSFALAFTGEIPRMLGSLRFKGTVGYAEQEPTIFAGTIRDNILFGKPFRPDFYQKVIEGCNLVSDLKLFANGDQSEVGEKGVNLSGGQKARIGLARAVYADADIYVLDDPLSAVDAKVAKSLFNKAISTLLRDKTVILITHQVHFVKSLESIIVLDEGRIMGYGSYMKIREEYPEIDKVFSQEHKKSLALQQEIEEQEVQDPTKLPVETDQPEEDAKKDDDQHDEGAGKLFSEEDANSGHITYKTYLSFMKEMGGFLPLLMVFLIFLSNEFASIGYGRILAAWASGEFSRNTSLAIMGALTAYIIFIYIVKNIVFSHIMVRASHRFHNKMLDRIVKNPVQFFDTNPLGRILNRFSNDLGVLDKFLPVTSMEVMDQMFFIGALIVTLAIIKPWLLIPLAVGVIGIRILLGNCYEAIKQSRKYELVSRSPLYSLFSASLSGMIIIRSYKQIDNFKKKFRVFMHDNTKGSVAFWSVSRFFGFYVDTIYLITGISNIFILTATSDSVGLTAFALVLILSITSILQYTLRQLVQTHVLMSSVERIKNYCQTPTEAALALPQDDEEKKKGWPQKGEIEFNKVYMKYRANTDHVLKDLSLQALPGEKIGCIGRTGAGKSSIIQTLFRMVEIDKEGSEMKDSYIKFDNVDTKTIGLHFLRNSISIIPQTPFIFSGNIRKNLDPIGTCTDEQLWNALEEVGLKKQVESLENKLYTDMTNVSSVFSVGQKQLICLARTILKKSKVLVLDEATANVDKQTDDFIQATIMKKFSDCTIFTIAHRLSTIANYDKVLVLDKGRKVEFDEPYKLLVKEIGDEIITNENGHFASMVLNTGPKTSQQILNVARKKYYSTHGVDNN